MSIASLVAGVNWGKPGICEGGSKWWARRDFVSVAGGTPRIALAQPIQSLQDVRRQAEGFQPSFCLGKAKEELVTAMQIKIDDFIAFMGQQEGMRTIKQINGDLPKADDHFATFEQLLNDGLNGASSCMNAG
ncbi:MAG: hypothetical protein Q7T36_05750 [Fluviicoccus sp.]|uniref:hypothetical protein n=1 Tax=Fluviicoccus sp. TaxID=2003552 RepID=UPI0027285CFB|nr:hypothetical protein [Fluviicoccus sp.]MDO8329958.1 hypothetical protein [Fluviicoccus sp.]